jgi:hypothetical protein
MKPMLLTTLLAGAVVSFGVVRLLNAESSIDQYTRHVAAGDTERVRLFIDERRARGEPALEELLAERNRLDVLQHGAARDPDPDRTAQRIAALDALIDAVGGQRYCTASRLFWHTDLDQALHASRESGKPVLSLRLLGKLTDELSCANSRFFRTTLYANADISRYLRDNFVLHWQSVRPAPVMTVDFGDGRRLIRTVTGNSIHYVLDAEGRPLDGLPGLYSPRAFTEWLQRTNELARHVSLAVSREQRSAVLSSYHQTRLAAIERQWQADLNVLGLVPEQGPARSATAAASGAEAAAKAAPAQAAMARAMTKAAVEARPVAIITMSRDDLRQLTSDTVWQDIATLHAEEAELDPASRRLIESQIPNAVEAGLVTITKSGVELSSLYQLFATLRSSTALDTVRNEYDLHAQIHDWFLSGQVADTATLNSRVYADLFLTPDSDPWLGLYSPYAYTGLANAGFVEVTQ